MESWEILTHVFRLVLTIAMTSHIALPVSSSVNEHARCSSVEFCQDILPYNKTMLPNILNHRSQDEAQQIYYQFVPLINTGCSKHLHHFLCFSLLPLCTVLPAYMPVCRGFCEKAVTTECLDILTRMDIGLPQVLNCQVLPRTGLCFGENRTSSPDSSTSGTNPTWNSARIEVDLYFLVQTGNNIQLLVVRSPNDTDTMTLYQRTDDPLGAALDYYMPRKYVYWWSPLGSRIYRGTLKFEDLREIAPIVDTGSANVESLVVDWNLCVIFWSESVPVTRIRTASLSGRGVKTVVSENLLFPMSLTVDPTEGLLFWIDRRGDEFQSYSTIESFSVVTNTRRLVLNNTVEGSRPRSLVADIHGKKLYWVDARSESLHCISYDGSGHKVLLHRQTYLKEPDHLMVGTDRLIWVDKFSRWLISANKHDGGGIMKLKKFETYIPRNLRLYGKTMQVNTTSYSKAMLDDEWKDLSSHENLGVPDLDEYGFRDEYDDYDDDEDDRRAKKDEHKNGANINSVNTFVSLICLWLLVDVLHSS